MSRWVFNSFFSSFFTALVMSGTAADRHYSPEWLLTIPGKTATQRLEQHNTTRGKPAITGTMPLMHILSQTFHFDAAHTLHRTGVAAAEIESSRRVHGHSYVATVYVASEPDNGMVMDLAQLRGSLDAVRRLLDHHHLDYVEGLGKPTLENLCVFIWQQLAPELPGLHRVKVERPTSGDACSFTPG